LQSTFTVNDISVFKQKVLNWLRKFNTFCFLDSNHYTGHHQWLIGAGAVQQYQSSGIDALPGFELFLNQRPSWLLGHLGYELITFERTSHTFKADHIQFPDIFFFEPEVLLILKKEVLEIIGSDPEAVFQAIENSENVHTGTTTLSVPVQNKIPREEYLHIIKRLQEHIHRGDCYEINFCQEFFSEGVRLDPITLFAQLNTLSPNPFAGLYKTNDKWLLCASPERFLKKNGQHIISQPIKGTMQRISGTATEKQQLLQSEKDKAENVMIVDLVRNDLSRICKEGSVKVDELFGIYSFPQVYQMISTISGALQDDVRFMDIINATFPMGSMTGAPKIKVMQLIDQYEKSKRGIFSGALGYFTPERDFDFNVVIRSMMYNESNGYLSFQTGGGITAYSNAEKEWEECMLKAKAIKSILGNE